MNYIAGSDRTEALLLPEVLDDYIAPENPVRFIEHREEGLTRIRSNFLGVAREMSKFWV